MSSLLAPGWVSVHEYTDQSPRPTQPSTLSGWKISTGQMRWCCAAGK